MPRHKPTVTSWQAMKQRCFNPRNPDFFRYGGRGITVSEELMEYEDFVEMLSERPQGTSLDRIDNTKNYTWENCRWASQHRQNNNRSYERFWTYELRQNNFVVFYWDGKKKIHETTFTDHQEAINFRIKRANYC